MKRFFGVSVLVMVMVVLSAWVVMADEPSHFHKLSLPAKWQGEWLSAQYIVPFSVTLEITRVDGKTVHVAYSWESNSSWNVQNPGSREEDAEIITHNGMPAFQWICRPGYPVVLHLEKDGTLTGECELQGTTSITMTPIE